MKLLLQITALVLLVGSLANAKFIQLKDFNYNPYEASIASAYLAASNYTYIDFQFRNDRNNVQFFEGRSTLGLPYFKGQPGADLVFVVPGWGGGSTSKLSTFIGTMVNSQGYHVINLPNPSSWQFILGVSDKGLPGYTSRDAKELQDLINKVFEHANRNMNLKSQRYHVISYSMGAIQAPFIAESERANPNSKLGKVILINPPTDIATASASIDSLFQTGTELTANRKSQIIGLAIKQAEYLAAKRPHYSQFLNGLNLSLNDTKWLIGSVFMDSLSEVLYTNDLIHKNKILKSPISSGSRTERWNEAKSFSFNQYMSNVVAPSLISSNKDVKDTDIAQVINRLSSESSITSKTEFLKQDKNTYLFHAVDDYLLNEQSVPWMEKTFGDRAYIYSAGGHVGQLWTPEFQADLLQVLKNK
jgi:hypothetical protein